MATARDRIPGQPRGPLALPHLPVLTTTPQRRPDCCLSLSTTLLQAILSHVQHATTHCAAASTSISTSSASPSATSQDEWTQGPDNSRGSAGPSEHYQDTIVSIGSGSGLLEACLQRHIDEGHRPSSPSSSLPSSPRPLPAGTSRLAAPSVVGVEVNQLTPFPSSSSSSSSSYSSPTQQQQQQGLNRYLPPHKREFVKGTWEMWPGSSPALGDDKDNDNDNSSDDSGEDDDPLRILARHSQDDELLEAGGEEAKLRGQHQTSPRHAEELSRRRRRCRPIALMFVYPRLPALVRKYVDVVSSSSSPLSTVRTIIYLGPRVDWLDFKPCFQHSDEDGSRSEIKVFAGEQIGLLEYEMMAVVHIR